MEQPIITKITSQECVGYRDLETDHPTSIIQNTGFDKNGQRWQWTTWSITRIGQDGFLTERLHDCNDYRKI